MHVPVDEHGAFVVVRGDSPHGAGQRVLDGAFGTRAAQFFPGGRDVAGQPAALVRAGRQAASGRRAPDPLRRGGQDLVPGR
ncbi:MAG TPA: hypothetical protein VJ370_03525, partial [Streptosporangiaceae bacterium]|nr:hypothetical protein [Streptosporangiaceae bacterium]